MTICAPIGPCHYCGHDSRLITFRAPQPAWIPIESAPKDGTRIILAKIGLTHDTKGNDTGSEEWKRIVFEEKPTVPSVWWAVSGSWRQDRWWDGMEPCGLAGPTHWMPIPPPPMESKL